MTKKSIDSRKGVFFTFPVLGVVIGIASCSGGSESQPVTTDLTWNQDIGPLVQTHCGGCHYAGGSGHFDLLHYESMKNLGTLAVAQMKAGKMPPWPPAANCREYLGDRTLPADVIPKFDEWVAGGMPAGAGEVQAFMPPQFAKLRADLTAKMIEPYTPDADLNDDYRCFVLDVDFPTDTWVEGVDVTPGTPQVHHVLTYAMSGSALEAALNADMMQVGPGYTCFGGPNPGGSAGGAAGAAGNLPSQLGAWVPGFSAQPLPKGTAMLVPGGSRLIMQVHYNNASGNPAPDQTSLVMQTRPDAPEFLYRSVPVAQPKLDIPAGDAASAHAMTITNWSSSPTTVMGVAGHMHMIGQVIKGTIEHVDKSQECLLDIPDWDFQWQMQYRFPEADYAQIQPGDSVKLDCIYDNSAANQPIVQGKPQEPQDVTWGEGTYDEMCLMYLGVITPIAAQEAPPTSACEKSAACMQACNPQSASCMLNCDNVSTPCLSCAVKALAGCGAVSCAVSLQAAQSCLIPCVMGANAFGGSVGTCMSNTCPNEWKAVTECLDPYLADPKCAGVLTGCGL